MEICIYLHPIKTVSVCSCTLFTPLHSLFTDGSPITNRDYWDSILECVNTAKPPRVRHPYATPSSKSSLQGTLTSTYMGSFPPSHLSVGPGRKLWSFSKPSSYVRYVVPLFVADKHKEPLSLLVIMVNLSHPVEADLWVSQPLHHLHTCSS